MLVIMPIKSTNKPAKSEYLIFFMPIIPKYNERIYKVVSVHPCKVDANVPKKLSTPYLENISVIKTKLALPEIGLIIAIGNTSFGKCINVSAGPIKSKIKSIKPLAISILEENIIAISDGNIFIPISIPSLLPLIKESYILFFFFAVYVLFAG